MELTRQEKRVLNRMKVFGFINPIISWRHCGVYRLSDVILRLRKKGYAIETEMVAHENSFGEPVKFAHYYLKGEGK